MSSAERHVDFYLNSHFRNALSKGRLGIVEKFIGAVESQGFTTGVIANSRDARLASLTRPGYGVFIMDDPFHPRALTMRLAYVEPFWRIETHPERWRFEVARAQFRPETISGDDARWFGRYWRKRLFADADIRARPEGFVYVPLQGLLTRSRSFQTMSPLAMLEQLATRENRPIRVRLHPNETYGADELRALEQLVERFAHVEMTQCPSDLLLLGCDYVATMNSSVAFRGFFLSCPAMLFARIDFHHIAVNVGEVGIDQAIKDIARPRDDYDKYLMWFLRDNAIRAWLDSAENDILARIRQHGWSI